MIKNIEVNYVAVDTPPAMLAHEQANTFENPVRRSQPTECAASLQFNLVNWAPHADKHLVCSSVRIGSGAHGAPAQDVRTREKKPGITIRSEEKTPELQSPMRTSYAAFGLKKK